MSGLLVTLRLVHIVLGVFWAGTMFFFVLFLEPSLRSLGPDGGKVMIKLFERGYMKVLPIVAILTVLSGLWMMWIVSSGFEPAWMGSRLGMALSTGGTLAIVAVIIGIVVVRPAGVRIWAIAREMPSVTDEGVRNTLTAEMGKLRARTVGSSRIIFALLIGAVALMAVARYL